MAEQPDAATLAKFDQTLAATRVALAVLAEFAASVDVDGAREFDVYQAIGERAADVLVELSAEISGRVEPTALMGTGMGMIVAAALREARRDG